MSLRNRINSTGSNIIQPAEQNEVVTVHSYSQTTGHNCELMLSLRDAERT